jgi:hypothetical protein
VPHDWRDDLWKVFEGDLFPLPSSAGLFNQYRDVVAGLDLPEGAAIRRQNFRNYLDSFDAPPTVLLVGEAAGHRGGRFSGIAFTSERQLLTLGFLPFEGRPSSVGGPYSEISATILWGELRRGPQRAMNWNAVPLHAHKPGSPLSNRNPTPTEVLGFCTLLEAVCAVISPDQVVALGRHAEHALTALDVPHTYVRHPASGGALAFRRDFRTIMGLS